MTTSVVNPGSTSTCPASKVHTPAPKQEDWRAFVRLCSDLSRLQADSDKVRAELDQAARKLHAQQELEQLSRQLAEGHSQLKRVLAK